MDKSKWEYKKLTDVCSILYGYPFDSKCFNDNKQGRPLIRIRDVVRGYTDTYTTEKCSEEYVINEGDLLIGMDGEFNISPWKSAPALLNQRVCKIKADEKNIVDGFMYYLMKTKLKEIENETAFVTVKHLSAKVLNKQNVQLPSIADQQRIVAELDCLNEMIALKQEQLKEFDKLAQSIFYDMFGDPVTNEKGWDRIKLGDICTCITKGTTPTTLGFPFVEEGVNFVKVESFVDGKIAPAKLTHITNECNLALSRSQLENEDLLVCIAGATIGKMAFVDTSILPANTNQACAIIRLKEKKNLRFIHSFLTLKLKNDIIQMGKGVAQPNLSLGQLRDFMISFPPLALQQQFAEKILAIEAQKELVKKSIAETQQLLASRMDYYFD